MKFPVTGIKEPAKGMILCYKYKIIFPKDTLGMTSHEQNAKYLDESLLPLTRRFHINIIPLVLYLITHPFHGELQTTTSIRNRHGLCCLNPNGQFHSRRICLTQQLMILNLLAVPKKLMVLSNTHELISVFFKTTVFQLQQKHGT
jgi:hypothetical protein